MRPEGRLEHFSNDGCGERGAINRDGGRYRFSEVRHSEIRITMLRPIGEDNGSHKLGSDLDLIAGTSLDKGAELDSWPKCGVPANYQPRSHRQEGQPIAAVDRRAKQELTTFARLVVSLAGNHSAPMSGLLTSLLKLSAVPARFGLVAAGAALSVGKSLLEPEPASDTRASEVFDAITDQQIEAAAGAIRASLLTGQTIDFHDTLRTKFPDATIRSIAEAALLAARNARISIATGIGGRH